MDQEVKSNGHDLSQEIKDGLNRLNEFNRKNGIIPAHEKYGYPSPSEDFRRASALMDGEEIGLEVDGFVKVGPGQWAKKQALKPVEFDPITRPEHYCKHGTIEPQEFIESHNLGWHEGDAVAYIVRARHKGNEIADLRKAANRLLRKADLLEKQG